MTRTNDETSVTPALPYATPATRSGSPTVAASILGIIGLGLIVLGGCFLIPMTVMLDGGLHGHTGAGGWTFVIILYALAFTCFGFAAWMLFMSARRLLRVMRE